MPEEIEVDTDELRESIDELREEREERAKEAKESKWTRFISLTTAIFAVIAAIAALRAGSLVNEAVIIKNDAVLQQSRASDMWNYYQAKGIKSVSAAVAADLLAGNPQQSLKVKKWREEAARQKTEQAKLMDDAKELEKHRDERDAEAAALVDRHEWYAYCVTCMQVAISLSAIAALTKRKDVWIVSIILGVVGTGLFVVGMLHKPAPVAQQEHAAAESKPAVNGASPESEGARHAAAPEHKGG